MNKLAEKCREFIVRQSCGEWTGQHIEEYSKDLVEFIIGLGGENRTLRDEFSMAALPLCLTYSEFVLDFYTTR